MRTATAEPATLKRVLDDEVEPFVEQLRAARYADTTVSRKRTIVAEFAQWAQQHLIVADNLNGDTASQFTARLPEGAKTRMALERATVRLFMRHLYIRGRLRLPSAEEPASGSDRYLRGYEEYLRKDRGLAENSVHVYVPSSAISSAHKQRRQGLSTLTRLKPRRSRVFCWPKPRTGRVSISGFWRHRSGPSSVICFSRARQRGTGPPASLWFGSTACRPRRHFFHPSKLSKF